MLLVSNILLHQAKGDLSDFKKLMDQGVDAVDDFFDDLSEGVHLIARTIEEWEDKFEDFLGEFGVDLDPEDDRENRKAIFQSNVEEIERLNAEALLAGKPPPYKMNHFAHLELLEVPTGALPDPSDEEGRRRAGSRRRAQVVVSIDSNGHPAGEAPNDWSWRNLARGEQDGALRSVKFQTCNNCWAHAAVDALENRNWIQNGVKTDLSVNYVADCQYERTAGNFIGPGQTYGAPRDAAVDGCTGGYEWYPFFLASQQGISTQGDYESKLFESTKATCTAGGTDDSTCTTSAFDKLFGRNTRDGPCQIQPSYLENGQLEHPGVRTIATTNEASFKIGSFQELKWELFNNGACSVGFGSDFASTFHAGTELFVPTSGIDHAVSVVGYGYSYEPTNPRCTVCPYMVCKNSWGTTWGDNGFFKMLATDEYFGSGAKHHLLRVHCPVVRSSGIGTTCADGELSTTDQHWLAPVQVNPLESGRTYSSVFENSQSGFGYARSWLNSPQAWSARNSDKSEGHYMIMDLGKEEMIAGVATQGRKENVHGEQWVTYYKVEVSNDKHTWTETYGDSSSLNGGEFYFKGNTDQGSYVTNMFGSPADHDVSGWNYRYVKIIVMDFHEWPSMRAGVVVYRNRGCWCAGSYCPAGTVCSHSEGCVAPGDGSTASVEQFGHGTDDATEDGTVTSVGETTDEDSASPNTNVDPWKTWGPVAVLANVLIVGLLAGAACVYCACIRRGEKEVRPSRSSRKAGQLEMTTAKHSQWVSHDSPRSPGLGKVDSHPI